MGKASTEQLIRSTFEVSLYRVDEFVKFDAMQSSFR